MTLSAPFHSLVWSYALQYGVQETDCLANLSPNEISYLLSSNDLKVSSTRMPSLTTTIDVSTISVINRSVNLSPLFDD